jgi:hypothetical protein
MTCEQKVKEQSMATRMNMMKLVQEIRGLAQITNRRPQHRSPAPPILQVHPPNRRGAGAKRKKVIQIHVREKPDIPHPVKITFI